MSKQTQLAQQTAGHHLLQVAVVPAQRDQIRLVGRGAPGEAAGPTGPTADRMPAIPAPTAPSAEAPLLKEPSEGLTS